MKKITLLIALIIVACSGLSADTWSVFTYDGGNPLGTGSPSSMLFTFNNNQLALNSDKVWTAGGSSAMTWRLLFSGNWAVCGTFDENGAYIPDAYATFVIEGLGGYVQWAGNTPSGYQTSLLVGMPFSGDGATVYTSQWGGPIGDVSASLALNTHPTMWGSNYNLYEPASHSFNAEYIPATAVVAAVPEPAGMVSLLFGGMAVLGFVGKRKVNRE